ncbi:MAG: choice-of-anchor V domain-containing protein [Flavobacteriales bacterium]
MNKSLLVLFGSLAMAFGLTSMTSNNAEYSAGKAGSNGSPGEGTCASGSCHNSFTLNSGSGGVSISIAGLLNGNMYVPGQTYSVNVTVQQSGIGLFGFGIEALQASGANAGSWTAGADSHILNATISGNSRATVAHIDNSGFASNTRTWSFSWTAPVTEIPVMMYAAGNAANNNGGDGGDYIYTTTLSLMPAPALQAPVIQYSGSLVICEGESVALSVEEQSGISYSWQNSQGSEVSSGSTFLANQSDCYTVIANDGSNTASSEPVCVTVEIVNSNFSGLAPMYCVGDAPVTLVPEVEGGIFSGPGVVGNVFNPAQMPVGDFLVGHTVITAAGCEFTQTQAVSIRAILPAEFADLNDLYCSTDAPVQLNPISEGGVFTGPVLAGVFDPNVAPGIYDITYTTGSGVCSASVTQTVEVLVSESSYFYVFPAFCTSSPVDQMIPEVPGGVFTGTGVSGDLFDPATALLGDNDITYTLVQPNGCISVTTQTVEVFAVANSDFTGIEPITCTTEGLVELVPASLGGVFSGPGVSGSLFDPIAAGAGQHTILYDISLGDCQSETVVTTTVVEGPQAEITVAGDLTSATAAQQGATYQWWNCDTQLPIEGATSAEFSITDPSQNGNYSVAVTLNGCDAMSDCVFLLIESVEELQQNWSAGFFPNPATTMLTVWSSTPTGVSIYNGLGALVLSQRVNAINHTLDIGELQQGIYQVVIQTNDGKQLTQLLVKQ